MKHFIHLLAFAFLSLFAFSCKKTTGGGTSASGVYVVGYRSVNTPNDLRPMIWKDGVPTDLSNGGWGNATSVAVYGNDVYVGGYMMLSDSNSHPVVWKNGNVIAQNLPDSIIDGNVTCIYATAMGVYASGGYYNHKTSEYYPVYWINKVLYGLEGGFGSANSICVSGSDVYVGGSLTDTIGAFTTHAALWKNGALIYKDTANGQINSVCMNGNDVYAVGNITTTTTIPVIWKNNHPTILYADGGYASHVFVRNGDVYVSGSANYLPTGKSVAMVWKNGNTTTLTGLGFPGNVVAAAMKNNDFYAISNRYDLTAPTMIFWKNGINSVIDSNYGQLNAIAVQ